MDKSELKPYERIEINLALLRGEEPLAALSRHYRVSEQTIYRWREQFLEDGEEKLGRSRGAADRTAAKRFEPLKRDLAKRVQLIGELAVANDIQKELRSTRAGGQDASHRAQDKPKRLSLANWLASIELPSGGCQGARSARPEASRLRSGVRRLAAAGSHTKSTKAGPAELRAETISLKSKHS